MMQNTPKTPLTIRADGHTWELFAEYAKREDAEACAFAQRMAGAYVRLITLKDRYALYGRPGRPHGRPRP